jgi:hypothetical protein
VDAREIERTLDEAERLLGRGTPIDLRTLGFWRAVGAVKRDPKYVERYADRIAAIDLEAFRRRMPLRFPAALGVALLVLGSLFGLVVLWLAAAFQPPTKELLVLAGMGAAIVCTHGLAHVLYGTLVGIRFTDWFFDVPLRPQPGFKTDYGTYLRAPASARAWMHASGAIVSKIVPFAVVPYATSIGCATWAILALVAAGIVAIVIDLVFSVRTSDWKRFKREMRLARRAAATNS